MCQTPRPTVNPEVPFQCKRHQREDLSHQGCASLSNKSDNNNPKFLMEESDNKRKSMKIAHILDENRKFCPCTRKEGSNKVVASIKYLGKQTHRTLLRFMTSSKRI